MPAIRSSTSRDPNVPPRPRNAWIIYRSLKAKELAGLRRSFVSKVIALKWKNERAEVKGYYKFLASKEKEAHAMRHPTYQYRPRQKTKEEREKGKRLREEKKRAKEEEKRAEQEEHEWRQRQQQEMNTMAPRNGTPTVPVPSMNFPPAPGPSTMAPSIPFPVIPSSSYPMTFSQAVDGLPTLPYLPQDNPPADELDDTWAQWQWPAEQAYFSTDLSNAGEWSVTDAYAENDFGVAYDFTGHLPTTGFDVSFNPGVNSYFTPF